MGVRESLNKHVCQIMETSWQAMMLFVPDDFEIIYANSAAKSIFGNRLEDSACFVGIESRETPCMDCPFMNLQIGEECITQRYYQSYDMMVRIKANAMDWGEGRRVILCTILDTAPLAEAAKKVEESDKEKYEEKLRLYGELYQTVVKQLKTIVFEYNCSENSFYVSPMFYERFGIDKIENLDFTKIETTRVLIYEDDIELYQQMFEDKDADTREVTCRLQESSGAVGWYHICIQNIRDEKGNVSRVIGTLKDVDLEVKSSEMIRHQSEYDGLTELYNANHFYRVVSHVIESNINIAYAIVAFDIDRFRMINDLFGMIAGDSVLRHIAAVLNDKLPAGSISCRMHSDIFVVCMPYNKKGDIIKCIEKIRKAIYKNDFAFDVNTTYGVYLVENRTVPVNLMSDRATLAGRTVKNNAIKFCAFYDEQYRNEMLKVSEIEQDMNAAIKDKQFVMYLQPKVSLNTGKICGAEVLARWVHPVKGLIQPNDFIPLFEKNGFIIRLDEYMWEEACKTIARWQKMGKEIVPLSVNISRYHVKNNDLVGAWKRLVRKYNVDPANISLEITETFFYDSNDLQYVMAKLQDMGFRLEMDDFGSGYSSLNMIRRVPVDTIKIDKDFLDQELATERGKIVITHTIAMAKDLRLSVVAEGVETQEHVDFLKDACCDVAQGYYFAKPMPLEDFERMFF